MIFPTRAHSYLCKTAFLLLSVISVFPLRYYQSFTWMAEDKGVPFPQLKIKELLKTYVDLIRIVQTRAKLINEKLVKAKGKKRGNFPTQGLDLKYI